MMRMPSRLGGTGWKVPGFGRTSRFPCFRILVRPNTHECGDLQTISRGKEPTKHTSKDSTRSAIYRSSGHNNWSSWKRSLMADSTGDEDTNQKPLRILMTADAVGGVWQY